MKSGDALPGLLTNGIAEDVPTLGATLERSDRGVQLRIPFFHYWRGTEHFREVTQWFDFNQQSALTNVLFYTEDGVAHLFRNRVTRTTERTHTVSTGVLSPIEVVLPKTPLDMPDELVVARLRSEADGLLLFTGYKSWNSSHTNHDDRPLLRSIDVHVEGNQELTWAQGEAQMKLTTDWHSEYPNKAAGRGGINVVDRIVLLSEFSDSRPTVDHIHEHRVFMDLLSVVLFGRALYLRRHEISDDTYAETVPDFRRGADAEEEFTHTPFHELLTAETMNEYGQPFPDPDVLRNDLLLPLRRVPQDVFDGWSAAWERWRQFILPLRWLLRRVPTTPDDFIVQSAIAFERASDVLGRQDGEEATYKQGRNPETTATHMYRPLHQLRLDFTIFGAGEVGVARAIANHYIGVKHPTGRNPEPEELLMMARLCQLTTRLFGLWIADETGALLTAAHAQDKLERLKERFDAYGFRLTEEGWFTPAEN